LNEFIKGLIPEKKEVFIWVKETTRGIETYSNPSIKDLSKPLKAQLKAFLEELIKEVK